MTASSWAIWNGLSMEKKHEVEGLAVGWQDRHARRTEAGMPASLPEVRDKDLTIEDASDDEPEPLSMLA